MKNLIILISIILGSAAFSTAQTLKFKIKNQPDTTIQLVKYVGSKLYYADTADIVNGNVTFDGSKQIPGVLAVLLPGQKYFEFVYNNEDVDIETAGPDFVGNMIVKKSDENKVFINYIKNIKDSRARAEIISKKVAALPESEITEKETLQNKIKQISDDVKAYQKDVIKKNPELLASKIIKMSMEVDLPEAPKDANGVITDSMFVYRYYRDHFFDNVDLKDSRLVNVPVLEKKLRKYISDQVLHQNADSLIKYIAPIMDKLIPEDMMYRYFTTTVTSHFEKSKIMGMDKVFHFMVLNYYCGPNKDGKPKGYWMDAQKLDDLCKDVINKRYTEIGVRPPNLILTDTTEQNWLGYYDLPNEYTVLYFWDPECGHCKKETPKLQKLYAEKLKARDVEIFSVGKATGEDFEKWKAYIKKENLTFINVGLTNSIWERANENYREFVPSKTTVKSLNYQQTFDIFSTPKVFVLDKDKKIIAKQLSIAQLEEFLDRMQGKEDAPKLFDVEEERKKAAAGAEEAH